MLSGKAMTYVAVTLSVEKDPDVYYNAGPLMQLWRPVWISPQRSAQTAAVRCGRGGGTGTLDCPRAAGTRCKRFAPRICEGASCFLKTRGRSRTPRGCCRALAAWDSVVVVPSHPCPPTPQLQIKPRNVHEHPSVAISKNIGTNPLCFSSCPGNPPNYAP